MLRRVDVPDMKAESRRAIFPERLTWRSDLYELPLSKKEIEHSKVGSGANAAPTELSDLRGMLVSVPAVLLLGIWVSPGKPRLFGKSSQ